MNNKKMRLFGGFFIACFLLFFHEKKENCNYIKIEAQPGGQSIPGVVLYIDTFDRPKLFDNSVYYKINDCDFSKILKELHFDSLVIKADTSSFWYYNYTVCVNGIQTRYATKERVSTERIFDKISKQITNPSLRQKIEKIFNSNKRRLGLLP
jgi:hypothetical protein